MLKGKKDCTQEGAVHQGSKTVAGLLSDILKCNAVVLLIDGLDEAAGEREQIEIWIDEALNDNSKNHLRMMVSTREYAFESSREVGRLREFESIQIQGLDEQRRELLIERRLKEEPHLSQDFQSQLQVVADKNPELATSPFLLSLIIEVFLKDVNHKIPTSRAGLYEKQIDGVLVRHQALKNPLKDSKALMQGTDMGASTSFDFHSMRFLLEAIAFSCQVRLKRRDFKWDSADLQEEVDKLSQLSHSEYRFCSISKFSLDLSSVGLLSKVGDGELRFSHLTLQEYLAASCAVRLFAHDPRELWSRLSTAASGHQPNTPVFLSYWRREVVQFTACMLHDDAAFEGFCDAVLESDDGSCACCEMVWDFLKERGGSDRVYPRLCDKLTSMLHGKLVTEAYTLHEAALVSLQGPLLRVASLLQEALLKIDKPDLALCVADLSKDRPFGWKLGVPAIVTSALSCSEINLSDRPLSWLEALWKKMQQIVREELSTVVEYSFIRRERLAVWVVRSDGELVNHAVIDADHNVSRESGGLASYRRKVSIATLIRWLHVSNNSDKDAPDLNTENRADAVKTESVAHWDDSEQREILAWIRSREKDNAIKRPEAKAGIAKLFGHI
jgi:hypothetical protein